jgi:ATP-dependent DNA helicase RecG
MRPDILNALFRPVTSLAGIGPKLGVTLAKLLGTGEDEPRVVDLLFHLPVAVIDRRNSPASPGSSEGRHRDAEGARRPPPAAAARQPADPLPRLLPRRHRRDRLTFFHAKGDWLEKTLPVGATRYVSGRMEWFNGRAGHGPSGPHRQRGRCRAACR